jgi:hypothetical protein
MNRILFKKVVNLLLFQVAWFAAVLGAAGGMAWLGPLALIPVLGIHLALQEDRRGEGMLILAAAAIGFLFDTLMVATGAFTPVQSLLPRPFSPSWMIGLWMNFAATLNVSLSWLLGRYWLAALFGGIGGPLAYYSGAKLGATETLPSLTGIVMLAVGWAIMTPLLAWLATRLKNDGRERGLRT